MREKNKKAESLSINKIISLIIVLVVLVLVILGVIYMYNKDFFNNLPFFSQEDGNDGNYDSTLCPFNTAEIKEGYIYIRGEETGLYLDEDNKIYFNKWGKDYPIINIKGERVKVNEGFLKGEPEYYKEYYKYYKDRDNFPTIEQLKMFDGSYRLGESRFFCKSNEEKTAYEFGLNCKESCSLYNGFCKNSEDLEGTNIGKLDCQVGFCYVSIKEEKTYDEGFSIESFKFGELSTHGKRPVLKNNFDNAEFYSGEAREFSYYISGKIPFCYVIRTDKKILDSGYFQESINDNNEGNLLFQYTNDKFFELIAWNPETGQKVYKKISLSLKRNNNPNDPDFNIDYFSGGKFVDDSDFKKEADILKNEGFFYITLSNPINFDNRFPSNYPISNYKIEKINDNEIVILGLYKTILGKSMEWHKLDCSTGFLSRGFSIYISELKDSLRDTIADQNCKIIDE